MILVAKLAEYQIRNHRYFLNEAISLTEKAEIKKPLRGELYDRNKILIASSIKLYRLYIDKSMVWEKAYDSVLTPIASILNKSNSDYIKKIKNSNSKIVYLEEELDSDYYSKLKQLVANKKLSCFGFEEYQKGSIQKKELQLMLLVMLEKIQKGLMELKKYIMII